VIDHVPVVVSDRGAEAYGQYYGATIARNRAAHRIVIFQDTLERDFGSDPDLLARQVERQPAPRGRTPPRLQRARGRRARPLGWPGCGETGVEARLRGVKVAYVFSTSGHTATYKLGKMILPQLEQGNHGVEVVGMFFFDDNTYVLRAGDPLGERLAGVAEEQAIMLMLCDRCAIEPRSRRVSRATAAPAARSRECGSAAFRTFMGRCRETRRTK
jgi:hypothetical protein